MHALGGRSRKARHCEVRTRMDGEHGCVAKMAASAVFRAMPLAMLSVPRGMLLAMLSVPRGMLVAMLSVPRGMLLEHRARYAPA